MDINYYSKENSITIKEEIDIEDTDINVHLTSDVNQSTNCLEYFEKCLSKEDTDIQINNSPAMENYSHKFEFVNVKEEVDINTMYPVYVEVLPDDKTGYNKEEIVTKRTDIKNIKTSNTKLKRCKNSVNQNITTMENYSQKFEFVDVKEEVDIKTMYPVYVEVLPDNKTDYSKEEIVTKSTDIKNMKTFNAKLTCYKNSVNQNIIQMKIISVMKNYNPKSDNEKIKKEVDTKGINLPTELSENETGNLKEVIDTKSIDLAQNYVKMPKCAESSVINKGLIKLIYKCPACNEFFSNNENLKTHLAIHTTKNPNICEICNKICSSDIEIKGHKIMHSYQKLHKCRICNRSFKYECDLKRHMLLHVGEKSYKCEICNKSFGQSGNLKKHMVIHAGEKLYKCEICSKHYADNNTLIKHMISHTKQKYKCDVCKKYFGYSDNLKRHLVIHTAEDPYKCEICNEHYADSNTLKKHIISHTKQKFKCEICNKCFSQNNFLKRHMLIHTGTKNI